MSTQDRSRYQQLGADHNVRLFAVGMRPSFRNHSMVEHARMPEQLLVDPDSKMNKHIVRGSTTPSWNMHGSLNKGPDKSVNVL